MVAVEKEVEARLGLCFYDRRLDRIGHPPTGMLLWMFEGRLAVLDFQPLATEVLVPAFSACRTALRRPASSATPARSPAPN